MQAGQSVRTADPRGLPHVRQNCAAARGCGAGVVWRVIVDISHPDRVADDADRHVKATISRSLEVNNQHFQQERERLEKWADDMIVAAEKELDLTKQQIKVLNREARVATTTDQQRQVQEKIQSLEKTKRRQRQGIFDREDEIADKRNTLIEALEKQLSRKTTLADLFTIRWSVA
ncbi:MAG: hypothetical protein H6816_02480 [Phycisphaerales bacterium]|nr:hypothetical protein [Phycisphaerales bacterium]